MSRPTKLDPARMERAIDFARQGLYANDIAERIGVLAETVRRWCTAANVPLKSPRQRDCDWNLIAEAADRNLAGESFASLGRAYGVSERTLADRIRFELAQRRRRESGEVVEPVVSLRGRRGSPESEDARAAQPALALWARDLRPAGRRIVLELVDDGAGHVVLVARVEPLHAAHQPCRRCADEDQRPVLAQESFDPASPYWAARALAMLGGGS